MHSPESSTLFSGFIQYAYQVDDYINPLEVSKQLCFVVYIGLEKSDIRINNQGAVTFASACQYPYFVAVARQSVGQVPANETGTTKDADCFLFHISFPFVE
jgi:hypothetical protein